MYSFIPQLLIILSIAGILIIVIRKSPEVVQFVKKAGSVFGRDSSSVRSIAHGLWTSIRSFVSTLWNFVKEAKGLPQTGALKNLSGWSKKGFSKIAIPKTGVSTFFKKSASPGNPLEHAQEKLEEGSYNEAEELFIEVLKHDPHNEDAYRGLGILYQDQKKYAEAIETYRYLANHHPENASYFSRLGQAYYGKGDFDKAIDAYQRALKLESPSTARLVNLGLALERAGDLDAAISQYKEALSIDPEHIQSKLVLAEVYIKKGENKKAEAQLEEVLQIEPTNHTAREKLMKLKF